MVLLMITLQTFCKTTDNPQLAAHLSVMSGTMHFTGISIRIPISPQNLPTSPRTF